jgi:hypothetical protein
MALGTIAPNQYFPDAKKQSVEIVSYNTKQNETFPQFVFSFTYSEFTKHFF